MIELGFCLIPKPNSMIKVKNGTTVLNQRNNAIITMTPKNLTVKFRRVTCHDKVMS